VTTDERQLLQWWDRWPDAATGTPVPRGELVQAMRRGQR
jgi:hypothetical protein